MTRKPLLVVFLTVFIDLVGFGIVLPLLPIYSDQFGAKGWMIGAIMASYSAMQFFFAPGWGRSQPDDLPARGRYCDLLDRR